MTSPKSVRIIGLTGGIATGKSAVAGFLEEQGALVIDADKLAREAVCPGARALVRIVTLFGEDMLLPDGSLDRKRLGRKVFADVDKRRQLEEILHPEIRRLAEEQIAAMAEEGHPSCDQPPEDGQLHHEAAPLPAALPAHGRGSDPDGPACWAVPIATAAAHRAAD